MARVLVVDDDPDIRETIASLLEDHGFEVFTARHGQDALAQLHAVGAPDLILLDLLMPVMDGVEFIQALREANGPLAKVPVVVVSASATVRPPPDILVVRKPFGLERLLDVVRLHVGDAAG
jgi:CheY-like chemotaxis protein